MTVKTKIRVISVHFYWAHEIIDDMLRYDSAFACDKFPNIVAYPKFRGSHGDWGGTPTVDRWRSFVAGFDARPMSEDKLREVGVNSLVDAMCTDGWYTKGSLNEARISLYDYINKERR